MEAHIEKRGDDHVFVCGGVTFPVFANDMVKSAYQVDELNDSARQTIMLDSHLPVEPWISEMSRFIIMGIIQLAWYKTFATEVPPKVLKQHDDRIREYPKLLASTADRRRIAAEKAAGTKAVNAGKPVPTPEELEQKRLAKETKDAEKASKKETREKNKQIKLQDKQLNKAMKQAQRDAGVGSRRAPSNGNGSRTKHTNFRYRLAESTKTIWSAFTSQKQIIVQAIQKYADKDGYTTIPKLHENVTFPNSKAVVSQTINWYLQRWFQDGLVERIEIVTPESTPTPTPAPAATTESTPPTDSKKKSKKKATTSTKESK